MARSIVWTEAPAGSGVGSQTSFREIRCLRHPPFPSYHHREILAFFPAYVRYYIFPAYYKICASSFFLGGAVLVGDDRENIFEVNKEPEIREMRGMREIAGNAGIGENAVSSYIISDAPTHVS